MSETRPTLPKPSAVIFDMDGLLFDSETLHFKAAQKAAATLAYDFPFAVFLQMIGGSNEAGRAIVRDTFGYEPPETFWSDWADHYDFLRSRELAMKPGVSMLLDLLDEAGVKRAICTSSSHQAVRENCARFDLLQRFDLVVARGDYAHGKPAPDPYLTAAARLGADPSACWALEDSHNGVRAAAGAGMTVIMIPDLLPDNAEMRETATIILRDLQAVCGLLQNALRQDTGGEDSLR